MNIFKQPDLFPLANFGLKSDFWGLDMHILMATWIAMAFLFLLVWLGRRCVDKEPTVLSTAYETAISAFMGMFKETFGYFNYSMFAFLATLFIFTFTNCLVGILPFVEEATSNLNTTLALGLSSFFCIQTYKIRIHGVGGYVKEFFEPFPLWLPFMVPIHVIGELAKVVSMSCRLFGNILGGSVIWAMILKLVGSYKVPYFSLVTAMVIVLVLTHFTPICRRSPKLKFVGNLLLSILMVTAWGQILLGIFEGIIQSFVITMLSMTYLAIGAQPSEEHAEHKPKEAV